MKAVAHVRHTEESLEQIYPANRTCDRECIEIREYLDPLDGSILEIEAEAVLPGACRTTVLLECSQMIRSPLSS